MMCVGLNSGVIGSSVLGLDQLVNDQIMQMSGSSKMAANAHRISIIGIGGAFLGHLISPFLRGDIEWSPRLSEVAPCDFYFHCYFKSKVY